MFYRLPHPWDPGYAIPDYIMAEPPGRGVYVTGYTPRKTIQSLIPQYLGGCCGGLGADELSPQTDPIARFGREVAAYLMSTVYALPAEVRKPALQALFDQLDPQLWPRVARKAAKLQKTRDMGPMEALEKAIASSTSLGLMKEVLKLGKSGRAPQLRSMIGLAAYGEPSRVVVLSGFEQALGFCGPICLAKKAGSVVKTTVSAPWKGARWAAGKGWPALQSAGGWAKDALGKIGSLACQALKSPAGKIGAGAGAAAMGAPPQVGMMGAEAGASMCPSAAVAPPGAQIAPPAKGFPIVPVAIGGAALLAAVVLLRRKK